MATARNDSPGAIATARGFTEFEHTRDLHRTVEKQSRDATAPAPAAPLPSVSKETVGAYVVALMKAVAAGVKRHVEEEITSLQARVTTLEAENGGLQKGLAESETRCTRLEERAQRHADHLSRLETRTQKR